MMKSWFLGVALVILGVYNLFQPDSWPFGLALILIGLGLIRSYES